MGKPTGFFEYDRQLPARRPVPVRLRDWREVYEPFPEDDAVRQGARCMDCGIPFCHEGCPLGNLIPEWNDLVYRGDWPEALERLHATNNFPEFTGRLCPAPCEGACVLGINADPVAIERIEYEIAERGWYEGWVTPQVPSVHTGKSVAVVGSGPAGLACAQQLARAGHNVVVYERAERPGGLLRYGIPEFKMEKAVLDRRLAQLRAEGVVFRCATTVGVPEAPDDGGDRRRRALEPGAAPAASARRRAPDVTVVPAASLAAEFDAVVLAGGATSPRDLPVEGRHLDGDTSGHGVPEAFQPGARAGLRHRADHGVGQAGGHHRRGRHRCRLPGNGPSPGGVARAPARDPAPAPRRPGGREPLADVAADPPHLGSAHEEGGDRIYSVTTTRFVDDGTARCEPWPATGCRPRTDGGRPVFEPVPGSDFELPCELVLLAMGFLGAERRGAVDELGLELDPAWQRGL